MSLYDYLVGLGGWNWFILAVILFAIEALIPGVYSVWFGVAAVIVGALALTTGIVWQWQLIVFALVAVATVFWMKRYVRSGHVPSDLPDLNARGAQYVGRVVVVEEPIRGGRGRVRVGDTLWQAEGADTAVGARVRVKGTNGTVLVVEREDT